MPPQNDKIDKFLEEYKDLTKRFGVDFVSYPMFVPNSDGSFKVVIQSTPVPVKEGKPDESFIEAA